MFFKKVNVVLCGIVVLSVSTDGSAMAGKVGRTVARGAGYYIGGSVGAGVGFLPYVFSDKESLIKQGSIFSQSSTESLQEQKSALMQRLHPKASYNEYTQICAKDPLERVKFVAPQFVGLALALCTRGKIKPVAIGAGVGALVSTAVVHDKWGSAPIRNFLLQKAQDGDQLRLIRGELSKR